VPSTDIKVRRETSRRCYRNRVARDKVASIERANEITSNKLVFIEISGRVRVESRSGWVSPQRILEICGEYMGNFKILNKKEVSREIEFYGYLWYANEVGVFMGLAPFLREDKPFEYFRKRVPKTQKSATKAELLILNTMIRFMEKGYNVKVFDERYT
jgi:hypothetical protein